MQESQKVCKTSDVPPGTMKTVRIKSSLLAVANIAGEFFVLDDTCTHEQCSLGTEGFLDEHTIICGCHGANFDVRNGKVLALPATGDLQTYVLRVLDGYVYIQIP